MTPQKNYYFSEKNNEQIKTGEDYTGAKCQGSIKNQNASRCKFIGSIFDKLNAAHANLERCDFSNTIFISVNFKGAKLNNAINIETAEFTGNCLFDDDTEINGIHLEKISERYPLLASQLRQHRYLNKFKNERPRLYKLWNSTCKCGRSWGRLFSFAFITIVIFTLVYGLGTLWYHLPGFPFLKSTSLKQPNIISCFQFSFLTFLGFSTPQVFWDNSATGFWVILEISAGLFFLGVLITVIATKISRNE